MSPSPTNSGELDHFCPNKLLAGELTNNLIVVSDFAKREFTFRRDNRHFCADADDHYSVVGSRCFGSLQDCVVIGRLPPRSWKPGVAPNCNSVAFRRRREHNSRYLGLPFGAEFGLKKPSTKKRSTLRRARLVNSAAFAGQTVLAPSASRFLQLGNSHHLTAKCARATLSARHNLLGSTCRCYHLAHTRPRPIASQLCRVPSAPMRSFTTKQASVF